MKIWELSVRRPVFMSCVLVALLVCGIVFLRKLPVELFPDVTFPVVTVTTVYEGAGPNEVETLISKPIEEELSTLSGIKNIRSISRESVGVVVAEFNLDVDVKYAEQQVKDRVSGAKAKLPADIKEPIIRRVDPSAQPIMVLAVKTKLKGAELYDLVNEVIRPRLEQVNQVGLVEILGARKREIQIQLDRNKMLAREQSVLQVVDGLRGAGSNIPAGKVDVTHNEIVYRTLGEYNTLDQIRTTPVSFYGNDVITRVQDVGRVVDTLEDEKIRAYFNGESGAFIYLYKQSGANTISVSKGVQKQINKITPDLKNLYGSDLEITIVRDMSRWISLNVVDVLESIGIGVLLTIIVVFLFLGSVRSTIITGFAIPVSLIGALALMYIAGMTINIMSLLAFSLAVGLLIDDAIVVRENIFRHLEMGKSSVRAALDGTSEVGLAVIAVTLAVLAVFGPIAFLSGVIGQFFKSFGLGVCFVMIISLFDALTNAPMLSAYFGGGHAPNNLQRWTWSSPVKSILMYFERFQTKMELGYERLLKIIVNRPGFVVLGALIVVVVLGSTVRFIPKTFLPAQEAGEFAVGLELKPGTSLDSMNDIALKVDAVVRKHPEVQLTTLTVGNTKGQSYVADIYVKLHDFGIRKTTTTQTKEDIRKLLQQFSEASPKVKDIDGVGSGQRPFVVNVRGDDLDQARTVALALYEKLKVHPGLIDPEITDKPGLPEFQVDINREKALSYGVTPIRVGQELRYQIEGGTPAKFREKGLEYDIRVRLLDEQRNLEQYFSTTKVPNLNFRLVNLSSFSQPKRETGPASINRENRGRYISIEADVAPKGPGMGGVIADINQWFTNGDIKVPQGVTHRFVGQAENFQELGESIMLAAFLSVVFIFLVLASLYESLVTPFAIMVVIPLAIVGGFFGLFIFRSSLDLFSMIGCVMLMGLATKNSIILVDYINQKIAEGIELKEAIILSGKTRLRPILMTSLALIAGMTPVAIGLNEASSQRKSLGIAVIGGVAISTLLTLVLVPAVFSYVERFRRWMVAHVGSKIVTKSAD